MSASAREVLAKRLCAWEDEFDWDVTSDTGPYYHEADRILAALSAAGFVVVPREPTEEMVTALWNALENDIPHTVTFRAALKVALSAAEGKK